MNRIGLIREFGITHLAVCLVWFAAVGTGLGGLMIYETGPARSSVQTSLWPTQSELSHSSTVPTVVMFIHPHCPCTRASLSELQRLHANCFAKAKFKLVALEPDPAPPSWRNSDLIDTANSIPDADVAWDRGGREAGLFNVQTSGHVVMYDQDGRLQFSGGITGSRGHEGNNAGRTRLTNWLRADPSVRNEQDEIIETLVFGCCLIDEAEVANE